MRRALIIGLVLLAGCRQIFGFDDLPGEASVSRDASDAPSTPQDVVIDTYIPDAGPCATLGSMCLGSTLRACTQLGQPPTDTQCAWSCSSSGAPHCAKLVPSGGGVVSTDLDPDAALAPINVALATSFNGTDGSITGGIVRPAGAGVISGIGFAVHNGVGVFRFSSLAIHAPVALAGVNAIAFVSTSSISVAEVITASVCTSSVGGVGGHAGGTNGAATGNGGGSAGGAGCGGGGGGGFGAAGGTGGKTNSPGGTAFGDPEISMLAGGGGGGQAGCGQGIGDSGGGAGGGAIQLAANGAIDVTAGGINAGGCGGKGGQSNTSGGGGGGAGGAILLEAPAIRIKTAVLAVNGGGGGGAGDTGIAGANGGLSALRAAGGAGQPATGGLGGASTALTGGAGGAGSSGGGGGGAVGRIRFNTPSGSATVDTTATLSPALLETPTTATQGVATTQ